MSLNKSIDEDATIEGYEAPGKQPWSFFGLR